MTLLDLFQAARKDGLTFTEAQTAMGKDAMAIYREMKSLPLKRDGRSRKSGAAVRAEDVYVLREFA